MGQQIQLDDKVYDIDDLSPEAKKNALFFQFAKNKIYQLTNTCALLERAKRSYIASLKNEMITEKYGLIVEDD
jgi:hypothetical protein